MDPEKQRKLEAEASAVCLDRRGSADKVPKRPFTTDGCTLWPDGNWQSCCIEHDMEYWCGGSRTPRKQADKRLSECVSEAGHPIAGPLMQFGTRVGGLRIWPVPWRWGYGWGWMREMQHEVQEVNGN